MNSLLRSQTWLPVVLMLTVLCHFGLGQSEASEFVLCFGANGHVAVEKSGHDHSVHSGNTSQTINQADTHLVGNDSPCTDIPVDGDDHGSHTPLLSVSKVSVDLTLLLLIPLVFLFVCYAVVILRRPFSYKPLFTDSRLLGLRSTVLLI